MEGIYALVDPNTQIVMYVGESKDIDQRFAQHCKSYRRPCKPISSARAMKVWVRDLLPFRPILKVLRELPGSDRKMRQDVEADYIVEFNLPLNIKHTGDLPYGSKWRRIVELCA